MKFFENASISLKKQKAANGTDFKIKRDSRCDFFLKPSVNLFVLKIS